MQGNLYHQSNIIAHVNVVNIKLPERERREIKKLGGPPIVALGRILPGYVEFDVSMEVSIPDRDLVLEYQGSQYKLEVEITSSMGKMKRTGGYIY